MAESYHGPQCPHCAVTLSDSLLRTGVMTCPNCGNAFEATAFQPPERRVQQAQIVGAGPEEGAACANHARNAAVASCQRCGLFICSLCDMNLGSGSYCPSCFERVRNEGTLAPAARRYKDFTRMGSSAVVGGILIWFLCVPLGALAIYYGVKGIRQRRENHTSFVGAVFVIVFGAAEVLGGIGIAGFIIYSIAKAP